MPHNPRSPAAARKRAAPTTLRLAWSALALLAVLIASLGPGLGQDAPAQSPPLATPRPAADALDLAAMTLNPDDLAALGLTGFGQQSSAFLTLEEQAEQVASSIGMDARAVGIELANAGFARRYQRQLGLPAPAGTPAVRTGMFVTSYIQQYASPAGAAAGFALLENEDPAVARGDIPHTRPLGDEWEVTELRRSTDTRDPYRALDLTFRLGNLVAGVTLGEFSDRPPDLATVEALGEVLLENVHAVQAGDGPGLSNLALRLGGTGVATRSDEYGRLDGQTFPNFAETAEELAERAARYGDAVAVHGVGQSIARGGRNPADDIRYSALLLDFASEQAAQAWLNTGVAQAAASPNVLSATPVEGASTIGDASLTLAMTSDRGTAGTARGYLIDTRVGARVAQIHLQGFPGVPLPIVEQLAHVQAACLRDRVCPESVPIPEGLPRPPPATPAASPVPDGEGLPSTCSEPAAASTTPAATPPPAAVAGADGDRPNIILILTDDLDTRSVACMPNVQSLLARQGVTFSNYFATTPLCCPSRASILRGQYAHNTGVLGNTGEHGGFPAFYRLGDESSTLATWLHDGGYRTALVGKYLNRYPKEAPPTYVPPGWDEWAAFAAVDGGRAYYRDYTLNENGALVTYGREPPAYSTDVLAAKAVAFVERASDTRDPFFLYLAPYAPHGPSTPAERHAGAFAAERAPRSPSFDEADVSDKPTWVRELPPLSAEQIALVDERHRERLRSLLAVDEMVADLIATLAATGELDNTIVVFSSDNGFHLGEHRLALGKQSPYVESVRVPLIMRGPGLPAGVTIDEIALNIDLAPTFAELAGVATPDFIDGRSLVPLMRGETPNDWRRGFLIEHYGHTDPATWGAPAAATPHATPEPDEAEEADDLFDIAPVDTPPYLALRTATSLYVEYLTGERELYDLRRDPHELDNLAPTANSALLTRLSAELNELRRCAGAACRTAEDTVSAPLAASHPPRPSRWLRRSGMTKTLPMPRRRPLSLRTGRGVGVRVSSRRRGFLCHFNPYLPQSATAVNEG